MSVPTHSLPTPEALQRALTRPTDAPVEIRESFASWVILTEDRAYRLFKRVTLAATDLTTVEGRLRTCDDAVRDEAELAAGIILGVRSVVPVGDSFALAARGHHDAVDHVVEMRRFADRASLAARLAAGELTAEEARIVAERLAAVHAAAEPATAADPVAAARAGWRRALDGLSASAPAPLPARRLAAIARFADAFARARGRQLAERAAGGMVRDGHGDLRPAKILVGEPGLPLVGRERFEPDLRRVDVGDDLAALLMHLELDDATATAEAVERAYRAAGGDPGDTQLLAAWGARRALVAAARSLALRGAAADDARRYVELAERLVWRARGPVAIVVCGRPRDARGRLAMALAHRSGWPLRTDGAVADAATDAIVEHPLADAASQRDVIDAIRRSGRQPRVVECRTPDSLHAAIAPDVPTRHRIVVDPGGDAEDLVDQVSSWLDASLRDLVPRPGGPGRGPEAA